MYVLSQTIKNVQNFLQYLQLGKICMLHGHIFVMPSRNFMTKGYDISGQHGSCVFCSVKNKNQKIYEYNVFMNI